VQIGEHYALVDGERERLVIVNAAGADVWLRLGAGGPLPTPCPEFLAALDEQGLLQREPNPRTSQPFRQRPSGTPEVVAAVPLQVAANNSGDPFAATGW
jgi:hypothetical protein